MGAAESTPVEESPANATDEQNVAADIEENGKEENKKEAAEAAAEIAPPEAEKAEKAEVSNSKSAEDNGNSNTDEEGEEKKDKRIHMKVAADAPLTQRLYEVLVTFAPLGVVAFGGPQAHVAILRDHLVVQRDWLDEGKCLEIEDLRIFAIL